MFESGPVWPARLRYRETHTCSEVVRVPFYQAFRSDYRWSIANLGIGAFRFHFKAFSAVLVGGDIANTRLGVGLGSTGHYTACFAAATKIGVEGMKVLVVDDEREILELLKICLSADGWEVACARDSETAYRIALEEPPQLLVVDLLLKTQNGKILAERIRALPDLGNLPIVFISASYTTDRFDLGGNVVMLPKPFDLLELQRVALQLAVHQGVPSENHGRHGSEVSHG